MRAPLNLLAFDLGASNGRAILGRFDGSRIELRELYRIKSKLGPLLRPAKEPEAEKER